MTKTRKVKSAGRFGIKHGVKTRKRIIKIESIQKKKQMCLVCKRLGVKRASKGIWECKKCGKRFASGTYIIE